MKRLVTFSVALLLAAACQEAPESENGSASTVPVGFEPRLTATADWLEELSSSLPEHLRPRVIGVGDERLLLMELAAAAFEPSLIVAPGEGISAAQALERDDLTLVIGSGFVTEAHSLEPVGLLQHEGTALSPVQVHGYTRILGINDQGLGVIHRKDYQRDLFHSALQVGPGIVEAGQLDISERDLKRPRYFRSFVAVCEDSWMIGVSLAPTHLRTLGELLLADAAAREAGCDEVVNLAGDRQAVLAVALPENRSFAHGDARTYKVSLLGFRDLTP